MNHWMIIDQRRDASNQLKGYVYSRLSLLISCWAIPSVPHYVDERVNSKNGYIGDYMEINDGDQTNNKHAKQICLSKLKLHR